MYFSCNKNQNYVENGGRSLMVFNSAIWEIVEIRVTPCTQLKLYKCFECPGQYTL